MRAQTQAAAATPAPQATPATSVADDKRLARAGAIKLSDLPSDWTASDEKNDVPDSKCQSVMDAKAKATARVESPDFSTGDTDQINDVVYVMPTDDDAEASFEALSSRDQRLCFANEFKDRADDLKDVKLSGKITTSEINLDPVGEDSAGGRYALPVKSEGIELTFKFDTVFVRQGRAVAIIQMLDLGDPDSDLRGRLAAIVARRLHDADSS
jgi:hypothetical protein